MAGRNGRGQCRQSGLTDLTARGVADIFLAQVDGRTGLPESIRAAFPEAPVKLCIVRPVRAALKNTTDKNRQEVAADLMTI